MSLNPYTDELNALSTDVSTGSTEQWENTRSDGAGAQSLRRDLIERYAWAIPNADILEFLADQSPIVEIGAGNGYWAFCIEQYGGDVVAFDRNPPRDPWVTVHEGTHDVVTEYSEYTLFLCWPSFGSSWPAKAIQSYNGDILVYIGEGRGGVTGSEAMHRAIDETFGMASRVIEIPQWSSANDKAFVFTRTPSGTQS